MIRLEKVNKYFNHYKKNQIHVINETSINLPENGLIALLGPSGSGKTTLLNVIGGLDNINSGAIYINDKKITKRRSYKVDEIRNLSIGYIFQDYKLIESMNVYDNVAISLRLIGVKDEKEIEKRVLYILKKVKMERYKNRPVSMLSGGERQRVGIARALVKNPQIILADEPTGNLDSKNSLEIMKIIKSISKQYLVILVTHEEELARFYATRILEIKDGKIEKDYENNEDNALNYELDNCIYLEEYKNKQTFNKDNVKLDVYRHDKENLQMKIIFHNGNIYIESNGNEKVEVIDNSSNLEIIDGPREEIKKEDELANLDMSIISNKNKQLKYSSIFSYKSYITYGLKKILDYPLLKKILLIGFFLSGMFIFYATSSIMATIKIKDEDFMTKNKNYLELSLANMKVEDYLNYEKLASIDYMLPSDSIINFHIFYDKFIQTNGSYGILSASLSNIKDLKENDLIMGVLPQNKYEVVITKRTAERFLENSNAYMAGFTKEEDLLNHDIYLEDMNPFKIVGIANINEPNIYINNEMFISVINNSYNKTYDTNDYSKIYDTNNNDFSLYDIMKEKIEIKKGREVQNDYEVIVPLSLEGMMELNKECDLAINNQKLKVVGFYENNNDNDISDYLVNENTLKYNLITKTKNVSIYAKDKTQVLEYFQDKKINIQDSYEYDKNNYIENNKETIVSTLIVSGVMLGISLIEIILMIRSSFLSRIKEVGIYRAIGIKKSDIYKMFSGEILAITFIASYPGIIFMAYILYCVTRIEYLSSIFLVNIFTLLLSLSMILIFNVIIGLFPVYNTIRKTPAQILARNDVD